MFPNLELMLQSEEYRIAKQSTNEDYFENNPRLVSRVHRIPERGVFFPMQDFTPLGQHYNLCQVKKPPVIHGLTDKLNEAHLHDGWLFLALNKEISLASINSRVLHEEGYIQKLIDLEKDIRDRVDNLLNKARQIHLSKVELIKLFNIITDYSALLLDQIMWDDMPESILERRSNLSREERARIVSDFLYPPDEVPYSYIVYSGLLKLAIESFQGFCIDRAAIFSENVGYMERRDIVPCKFESIAYLKQWVEKYITNRSKDQTVEEREDFFRERLFARARQSTAHKFLLDCYKTKSEDYFEAERYLKFMALAMEYNERNRKRETNFFKILEKWFIDEGVKDVKIRLPEIFQEV